MTVSKKRPAPSINEQIFKFQTSAIHVKLIDEQPHFLAKEVCSALGISNYRDAVSSLDEDESYVSVQPTRSGVKRHQLLVNESGLYGLIFQSRKKEARAFRKWVTSEVLPSIRKQGFYTSLKPVEQGKYKGIIPIGIDGDKYFPYLDTLRQFGLSTTSGTAYKRKKRFPEFFIKFLGRTLVRADYAEKLHQLSLDNQLKLSI